MATWRKFAVLGAAVLGAGAASAQQKQEVNGPVSTYWVSAETSTGMGAGGGANMGAQMMRAMQGGGESVNRTLILQLGSSTKPAVAPAAEHLPPAGLKAGPSLPLVTRKHVPGGQSTADPTGFQKPKGKMLIFWGCGDHAKAGQPVVIDFAKLGTKAPMPSLGTVSVTPMKPPSPERNATYGDWPNEKTRTSVPANGSLIGDHLIRGNYTKDIRFSLGQTQDFLAPLVLTSNEATQAGSVQTAWKAVPNAQAYLSTVVGGSEDGQTVVMWTSSEVQAGAIGWTDYMNQDDLRRLVAQKVLMSPQTTSCKVPAEVVKAAPTAMLSMIAFGGEANFSYPPRPSDPKVPWNIDWTVKVRYKSTTGGMLGMDMAAMMNGADADADDETPQPQQPQQPPSKTDKAKAVLRGLGALGSVLNN